MSKPFILDPKFRALFNAIENDAMGGLMKCQKGVKAMELGVNQQLYQWLGAICAFVAQAKCNPVVMREFIGHVFWIDLRRPPREKHILRFSLMFAYGVPNSEHPVYDRVCSYARALEEYVDQE